MPRPLRPTMLARLTVALATMALAEDVVAAGRPTGVENAGSSTLAPPAESTRSFTNPVVASGADPWVIRHGRYYYFCQSRRGSIQVNKAARLQDLGANEWKRVWTPPPGTPYSRELWAPELHYLRGRWWIYVAADDGDNANHRMYVLEGSSNDPQAPFAFKGKIAAPTDRWAIDGTVLQMPGDRLYFVWSGWEGSENVAQHLYLAPMSDPWTIRGERVRISTPEYEWEKRGNPLINEGPQVLWNGDKLFIIYSASGSWGDDYCLGQLAWTGGEVLDPKSWVKQPRAVFSRTQDVFGPGHCCFVKSRDGREDWIIYHSAKFSGAGWNRRVNMQRFTWNPDGSPSFGMPVPAGVPLPEPSGDSLDAPRVGPPSAAAAPTAGNLAVIATANTRTPPLRDVFELSLQHDGRYADPFFDVTVDVTFTAPGGKEIRVGGFHYGSSTGPEIRLRSGPDGHSGQRKAEYHFAKQDLWKARFAPGETGRWTYAWVFTNRSGGRAVGSGTFDCVRGRVPRHGFVRANPANPFRWVFENGTPYFPIGLQECIDDNAGVGSVLAAQSLEGPFRLDRTGRPDPPSGAVFQPGPAGNPVNGDVYFRQYARAGFNLFRFSQQNCSLALYQDLDHYLVQPGVMVDELLQHARKYGFRIVYGLFGYQPVFNNQPDNAEGMAKLRRFVKYSVDRWGAYVDFWEFLNEQKADARWYEIMTPYLRSLDPYQHPITTSWERPELPGIDVNAPHWYSGVRTDLSCDRDTAEHARNWKRFNKPVIVGEQGNSASKEELGMPGIGGVWDIGSSTRMRIRNWVALFNEISFIFWNTSYARDGHSMNIWLGPEERQYVHAMQDFANRLDNDVRVTPVTLSEHHAVRAWGLTSKERAAIYLHHFADHTNAVTNLTVTIEVPEAARGCWYSPQNASILQRVDAPAGRQTFLTPPFTVDLALLITPDAAPDIDRDGLANDRDADDDNDHVPDTADAFPLDPEEWADQDGDLIGDNFDADLDADGRGDDKNHNRIRDHEELDFDGDGIPRANALPWDAFPLNPKEWRDTDGDGLGDNADTDKDGDGWTDDEERRAGTGPLDPLSFPLN